MIKIEIKEKDIKKALSNFTKYDKNVQKEVKEQIASSALAIETTAKRLVPVKTGRLRSSINSDIANIGAIVGTNVEYAPSVEFGTVKRPAKPFLFPAFEGERPKFVRALINILKLKK